MLRNAASARLDAYSATSKAADKTRLLNATPATKAVTARQADAKSKTLAGLGGLMKAFAAAAPKGIPALQANQTTTRSLDVKPQDQFANTNDQNACGTTSLAMIMDYFNPGRPGNDHFTIDKQVRRADLFSTPDNLARYAEDHGFRSSVKTEASLSDIKYALDRGLPVQVVIDPDGDKSDFVTHFVVVEGYETDKSGKITGLKISDPAGGKKYTLDADTFMKRWSDLEFSNIPSGMSRQMITYAPKDGRPIKGLDGVTRRACDIDLPGNSLLHDMFSNSTPARTLGSGISDVVSGAANLKLGTFLGGIVKTVGGGVGYALSLGGHYAQKGGDAAIKWANNQWKNGGFLGKVGAVFGWVGGGIAKGVGFAVQKVGNFIGWAAGKVGDAVRWVGDKVGGAIKAVAKGVASVAKKVWGGIKAVGKGIANAAKAVGNGIKNAAKAVGNGIKNAAKAIGNGIKKIFSGW